MMRMHAHAITIVVDNGMRLEDLLVGCLNLLGVNINSCCIGVSLRMWPITLFQDVRSLYNTALSWVYVTVALQGKYLLAPKPLPGVCHDLQLTYTSLATGELESTYDISSNINEEE